MKPTIGRIVRFVGRLADEWPAIITVVHSNTLVSLQVFRHTDVVPGLSVPFDAGSFDATGADPSPVYASNSWHWPERS